MSKILRIALAIALITVFYTGELVGIMFDYHRPPWFQRQRGSFLLFATQCREWEAAVRFRARTPRNLAFWAPSCMFPHIPGRLLHFCVNEKLVSPALRYC